MGFFLSSLTTVGVLAFEVSVAVFENTTVSQTGCFGTTAFNCSVFTGATGVDLNEFAASTRALTFTAAADAAAAFIPYQAIDEPLDSNINNHNHSINKPPPLSLSGEKRGQEENCTYGQRRGVEGCTTAQVKKKR